MTVKVNTFIKFYSKPKNIKSSIIIVTYNSKRYLRDLFETISSQDYDLARLLFVVVDNDSVDGTFDELASFARNGNFNIMSVRLNINVGFAPANNVALHLLKNILGSLEGRSIVLLNPDTRIIDKSFLKVVERFLEHFPIVGFSMISGSGDVIDSLGAYVDYLGNPQDILCGVKLSRSLIRLINLLPKAYYVASVCFAAVAIRGDLVERLGTLRSDYVIYFEDTEFCLRCWSKGVPVLVYRDPLVWHERGGTQKKKTPPSRSSPARDLLDIPYHFAKNSLLLTYEYLGISRYVFRVLVYLAISLVLKRQHLIFSTLGSAYIILKKRLKPKRLPKGLVLRNPRTWILLWTLKYCLKFGFSLEEAISYSVKRASLEYLLWRLQSRLALA